MPRLICIQTSSEIVVFITLMSIIHTVLSDPLLLAHIRWGHICTCTYAPRVEYVILIQFSYFSTKTYMRHDQKACGKVLLNRIAFIDCNENSNLQRQVLGVLLCFEVKRLRSWLVM